MVRFNFPSLSKKVSTDVLAVQSDGSQTDGIIKQDISFILQPVLEQLDDDAVMWSNWKKKNRQTETEMSVKSRSASLRLLLGSGNLRLNPAGKQTNWRNDHSREEYNQTVTDSTHFDWLFYHLKRFMHVKKNTLYIWLTSWGRRHWVRQMKAVCGTVKRWRGYLYNMKYSSSKYHVMEDSKDLKK